MEAAADVGAPGGEAAIGLLVDQRRLVRWQIAGERAGFALKVLTAVAGLAVASGLALMAWSASQARGVRIEEIAAPPELQAQGLTGTTLAAQLQDRLKRMQRETRSQEEFARIDSAHPQVKVEIPNTGVSLDEVARYLRGWLGHETPITGELVDVKRGPETGALALTVRVGDGPGERVVSPEADVEALLTRAAEAVYWRTEPRRYVLWLRQHDRQREGRALVLRMRAAGSNADRSWAYTGSAGMGDMTRREPDLRMAVRLDPGNCAAWNSLFSANMSRGDPEAALAVVRRSLACRARGLTPQGQLERKRLSESNLALVLGDRSDVVEFGCFVFGLSPCRYGDVIARAASGSPTVQPQRFGTLAYSVAEGHDATGALRVVQSLRERGPYRLRAEIFAAMERGEWPTMLAAATEATALPADLLGINHWAQYWRAFALTKMGRYEEAKAAITWTSPACQTCRHWEGRIAAAAGDSGLAEQKFAEAARLAPSLPQPLTDWAGVRLAAGDPRGAIAKAKAAHKLSRPYPDALEIWGEALLARGDASEAVRKFETAAKFAPRWGRLHLKWGEALAKLGKADEARVKWRAAAGMDLTAAERTELATVSR